MIQGWGEVGYDRVVPVFGSGSWLAGAEPANPGGGGGQAGGCGCGWPVVIVAWAGA